METGWKGFHPCFFKIGGLKMSRNRFIRAEALPVGHLVRRMHKYRGFYLLFLPVLAFTIVFHYLPMFGLGYAFTDYRGIRAPQFTGLGNFRKMFSSPGF